jgi:N-glycosylase/DNA lyase
MWKTRTIKTEPSFNFQLTIQSHGWYGLLPFLFDAPKTTLEYPFLEGGKVISASVSHSKAGIKIVLDQPVSEKSAIPAKVRHIFRLDDDLEEFYSEFCGKDGFEWVRSRGAGRLLRSPTVFEDVVKTMCTTNCSWGLTKKMVANLVGLLGERSNSGNSAFPTAEAMAAQDEKFYRDEIRAGYRSPYFVELAGSVASKKLDPETWMNSELPTVELKKQLKSIKGIGDYAAENMLKLLGRYDGLALDSWLRAQFYKKHNAGRKCSDKKIDKRYSKFGEWKGLAIWCDMTAEWHSE